MKSKVVKKETLEEFIARGGKVQVIPYQKPENEEKTTVYPRTPISHDFMDLNDGEFYYSDAKSSAKKKEAAAAALIDKLPDDIKDLVIKEFL